MGGKVFILLHPEKLFHSSADACLQQYVFGLVSAFICDISALMHVYPVSYLCEVLHFLMFIIVG